VFLCFCFCFFFQFVSASAVVETMSIFLASISHCRLNKIRGGESNRKNLECTTLVFSRLVIFCLLLFEFFKKNNNHHHRHHHNQEGKEIREPPLLLQVKIQEITEKERNEPTHTHTSGQLWIKDLEKNETENAVVICKPK